MTKATNKQRNAFSTKGVQKYYHFLYLIRKMQEFQKFNFIEPLIFTINLFTCTLIQTGNFA